MFDSKYWFYDSEPQFSGYSLGDYLNRIPQITNRRIATNGIELNIAEQGDPNAPLIVMLHGFPESWFSWRHQFAPLAAAGYHVVAPDMRGYGDSDKPADIGAYNQIEVVNDIKGLVAALGYETAIVLGHDWGGPTAWSCALWHPDIFSAVGVLSVPFSPRSPIPPLDAMKAFFAGKFFYQLYFQTPAWQKPSLRKMCALACASSTTWPAEKWISTFWVRNRARRLADQSY